MGFLGNGSVHKRDKNLILTPKGIGVSTAVITAQQNGTSPLFVNSFNAAIPGTALAGDFAVFIVFSLFSQSVSTPAGWTLFGTINVQSNGTVRIFTRVLQPGDTTVTVNVSNVGTAYLWSFQSYTGATEIAVNSQLLDQASALTISFANTPAPLREMHAILVALRSGLNGLPWFAITAQGNLAPIAANPIQQSMSSGQNAACATANGRLIPGATSTGIITGSIGAANVTSSAVLLIR